MTKESIIKTFYWKDVFEPEKIHQLLHDIKWSTIHNTETDNVNKQTIIYTTYNSSSSSGLGDFELIPSDNQHQDNIHYLDRTLIYSLIRTIKLSDFPEVCHFIINYCPHMKTWYESKDHIMKVHYKIKISRTDDIGIITDYITDFKNVRSIFSNNDLQLSIVVLAAFMKSFYDINCENFQIQDISLLKNIKRDKDALINVLENPTKVLNTYKIEENDSCNCVVARSSNRNYSFKKFKFFGTDFFETPFFEMYEQNFDLKYLACIVNVPSLVRNFKNF